jgi:hypothetical protein
VLVIGGHCMTYPMPRMGRGRIDGASGLVILVLLVPFGLCHLGESLAGVVAKRGELRCGFDLLCVARARCAVVLYALDHSICTFVLLQCPLTKLSRQPALKRFSELATLTICPIGATWRRSVSFATPYTCPQVRGTPNDAEMCVLLEHRRSREV